MTTKATRHTSIKAGIATVVAATGLVAIAPGTGHADGYSPGVCRDGLRLVVHYVEVGDQATASALFDNLWAGGCR
jgi:hypothetical protein